MIEVRNLLQVAWDRCFWVGTIQDSDELFEVIRLDCGHYRKRDYRGALRLLSSGWYEWSDGV